MGHKLKILFSNIISPIKKFFSSVKSKIKKVFCNTCEYFKNKKFFLIVILYNMLFLGSIIYLFYRTNRMPITLVVGVPSISILILIAWYAKELVRWSNDKDNIIKKIFSSSMEVVGCFLPILSFYSSYKFAELYFEENVSKYETFFWVFLIIFQLIFVIFYCYELIDINGPKYDTKHKVLTFSFIIIHIIQLFTNIYLLFLAFNPNSLQTITAETPFHLAFDIIYFSAMTFVGVNPNLSPCTRLTQTVVLVESIIFTIYISIIIFNLIASEKDKKDV